MAVFQKRTRIKAPVEAVFKWHERPGAFERLTPPWEQIDVLEHTGGIKAGATRSFRMKSGPIPIAWHAEHTDYVENEMFRDRQIKGPFSKWVHTHRFEPDGGNACFMEDHIEYVLPMGFLGRMAAERSVRKKLEIMFAYRHSILKQDMAAHQKQETGPLHVLVSGASGVLGRSLVPFLTTGGHQVTRLVRHAPQALNNEILWDPTNGFLNPDTLHGTDIIIHLAGENIGEGKWTAEKKRRIVESRTMGTSLIAETAAAMNPPPKTLICASAIGYYGNRGDCLLEECDLAGDDFISKVCCDWEQAATPAVEAGIRVVFLRIGIALTPAGGALKKLITPFKMGLGAKIADGSQYMSWISIDDVVGAVHHLMFTPNIDGPVNLVAPNPVTNIEFTRVLAAALNRPALFKIPAFAIKAAFGELGVEVPLSSTRVTPTRLMETGYEFRYPDLFDALAHLLGTSPARNTDPPQSS